MITLSHYGMVALASLAWIAAPLLALGILRLVIFALCYRPGSPIWSPHFFFASPAFVPFRLYGRPRLIAIRLTLVHLFIIATGLPVLPRFPRWPGL
jgi:hypothetical protein